MTWGAIKRNATDALFSDIVRIKAGWICERCKRNFSNNQKAFDCSHFFGRRNKSTRWLEENASALCRGCHNYFGENPSEHNRFMEKKLGLEKFEKLVLYAHTVQKYKVDEKLVRIFLKAELEKLKNKGLK